MADLKISELKQAQAISLDDMLAIVQNVNNELQTRRIRLNEVMTLYGATRLQGEWNASQGAAPASSVVPIPTGYAWRISVAGTTDLGGITDWNVGDMAVKTDTGWLKIGNDDIGTVWGNITGNIESQTDLMALLNKKVSQVVVNQNNSSSFLTVFKIDGSGSLVGSGLYLASTVDEFTAITAQATESEVFVFLTKEIMFDFNRKSFAVNPNIQTITVLGNKIKHSFTDLYIHSSGTCTINFLSPVQGSNNDSLRVHDENTNGATINIVSISTGTGYIGFYGAGTFTVQYWKSGLGVEPSSNGNYSFKDWYFANDELLQFAPKPISYNELKQLITNQELMPGRKYQLTDFKTIYKQPVSDAVMEAETGERLVLTALSKNEIERRVQSLDFPKDIIEYEVDSNVAWNVSQSKGQIVYRKDENENECGYDHRTIKFRRWASYYDEQTEQYYGYVIPRNDTVYNNDTLQYEKKTYGNGAFVHQDDSVYMDFLTFTHNSDRSCGNKIGIGAHYLPNVVCMGTARNNTIIAASDITLGGIANNNTINSDSGNTYFGNNVIYTNNVSLNFITGSSFINNVIQGNVLQNTVFSNDTINNTIRGQQGAFSNNYFGDDCQGNVLKSTRGGGNNNTTGRCFKFNDIHCIGSGFSNNTIGQDFSSNRISGNNCFTDNTIDNFFQGNTICGHYVFTGNKVNTGFLYNSITGSQSARNCEFNVYFEHNVINQALQNCKFGVYNAYNEFYYELDQNNSYSRNKIETGAYCKRIQIHGAVSYQTYNLIFGSNCENIVITKDCNFNASLIVNSNTCNLTISQTHINSDLHIRSDHFTDIESIKGYGTRFEVFGNDIAEIPIRIKYLDIRTGHDTILEATNR